MCIDRTRRFADGHKTTETALFLSSLPADAPTIANAARNLSALRVLCLNLLRHSTLRGSLRIKRLRLAFNPSLLETLLASV